jgi:hypothetical protein
MRVVVSTVLVALVAGPLLLAQARPAIPRSVDGHPDLQGVWNFSTITPLERPAEFAGREFLTDEEAREYESRTVERSNRDARDQSADADVASAYNEFWWDRGVHAARVNGRTRTSLIVDPPDGRIPALTPDGRARAAARAEHGASIPPTVQRIDRLASGACCSTPVHRCCRGRTTTTSRFCRTAITW